MSIKPADKAQKPSLNDNSQKRPISYSTKNTEPSIFSAIHKLNVLAVAFYLLFRGHYYIDK